MSRTLVGQASTALLRCGGLDSDPAVREVAVQAEAKLKRVVASPLV